MSQAPRYEPGSTGTQTKQALGVEAASFYEPVILKPSKMIHMLLSCYPLQLQIAKHLQSSQ
jgi:hypothetical protein